MIKNIFIIIDIRIHNFKINLSRLNNYDKRTGNVSVKDCKRKLTGKYTSQIFNPNDWIKIHYIIFEY